MREEIKICTFYIFRTITFLLYHIGEEMRNEELEVAGGWWLVTRDEWLGIRRHQPSDPHIVISSASEKSLSFAFWRSTFGNSKQETCCPLPFGHRHYFTPRRFYIFMRRTTISHFSFLIPHSSRAEPSSAIKKHAPRACRIPP